MPQLLRKNRTQKAVLLLGVVLVLTPIASLGFWASPLRSLATFRQVDDYPLYVMHLYGGYGSGDLEAAGGPPAARHSPGAWACTVFAALNGNGSRLVGRNFDWFNRPSLLLYTHPSEGYASVSMVDISYLGFGTARPSWTERLRLFKARLLPFDGMNEAGLAVGMMALPQAQAGVDPGKRTVDSLYAIRLLLDRAATVDEAVALLGSVNVDWGGGPPLHYLVADAAGESAVIEFVGGEMKVLRNEVPWQVATNFQLSGKSPAEAMSLCQRYRRASEVLEENEGSLSVDRALSLLGDVSQEITMWSVVYDVTEGDIAVAMGRDYAQVHRFELAMDRE